MAAFRFEITEDARADLSYYTAFERKIVVSQIRDQLTHQPAVATRNRKRLRDNPIARWELRIDKYRIFYDVDEDSELVIIVAVGHKDHEVLWIRDQKVNL
jgi:mRNA-degrading endonuclease RelE of RelBE toxin-antitoxin system